MQEYTHTHIHKLSHSTKKARIVLLIKIWWKHYNLVRLYSDNWKYPAAPGSTRAKCGLFSKQAYKHVILCVTTVCVLCLCVLILWTDPAWFCVRDVFCTVYPCMVAHYNVAFRNIYRSRISNFNTPDFIIPGFAKSLAYSSHPFMCMYGCMLHYVYVWMYVTLCVCMDVWMHACVYIYTKFLGLYTVYIHIYIYKYVALQNKSCAVCVYTYRAYICTKCAYTYVCVKKSIYTSFIL
jgi:hypothetical protein